MMKRILSFFTALMLLFSTAALAEEKVYDLIENALYRIVLRTEEGDEPLGTGVLFSDSHLILTAAACLAEGEIVAIGQDGEHAVVDTGKMDESGLGFLELAEPAAGTPLYLAAEEATGMAALFSAGPEGECIAAPLEYVRSTIFRGQSAQLLTSAEGLLPGSFLTDENGALIGVCIAQQAEGRGTYIALDANGLFRAISRQQYADAYLPVAAVWEEGVLTLTWTDEERDSGMYLITISGDDNRYYTFFEAEPSVRTIDLTLPPEHRYDFQVQWTEDASRSAEPVWSAMSETFIPGDAFRQYNFDQECSMATRTAEHAPVNMVEQPDQSLLNDGALKKYLHITASYDVAEKTELPMTIELIAPDGQFYFESAAAVLTPEKEKEDVFLLPLDDLLADCAEFSGGALAAGQYLVRYTIAGGTAGEYAFTLEAAPAREEQNLEIAASSGLLTDVDAHYENGALSLAWDPAAIPEEAVVTVYYMYGGNNYYVYHQMPRGECETEIYTVPGRETILWISWAVAGVPAPEPPQESDFIVVPAAEEQLFTLHGFENKRMGLAPSSDPKAGESTEFLPEVKLTRELLMDETQPLYFQTEDTYQVTEKSEDHPMMLVLCTPEGLCFFHPLLYIFDPALQQSDLWLTDVSSVCRDYESLICGAWPAGHYRFLYCIDGQIAGEYHFTLE